MAHCILKVKRTIVDNLVKISNYGCRASVTILAFNRRGLFDCFLALEVLLLKERNGDWLLLGGQPSIPQEGQQHIDQSPPAPTSQQEN